MKLARRICTEADVELWKNSETHKALVDFVVRLSDAVQGKELGKSESPSKVILQLLDILAEVRAICAAHPPSEASSRFGKTEFRDFYDEVTKRTPSLLTTLELPAEILEEAETYFIESWGNRQRIDYGSGHELNFLAFLYCLESADLLSTSDDCDLVLAVFATYLSTMRDIQKSYWLEPAGSHGVWGLDDYHFLPFLFGSGQLVPHPYLRPISIHDRDMVDMFAQKYLYFACIQFINSVKTASLRWHSPMLDDISGVKKWSKVNEGMIKMYKAEVLGKRPIMQHFMFGSVLPAPEGVTSAEDAAAATTASEAGDGCTDHGHKHGSWADCCGIKVPSAIAAGEEAHKRELRPLPFD